MSHKHTWSTEAYDGPPTRVCIYCNEYEVEHERDAAIAERDQLRREVEALRDRVVEWAERDPGLDDIVVALNLIVDGVPT